MVDYPRKKNQCPHSKMAAAFGALVEDAIEAGLAAAKSEAVKVATDIGGKALRTGKRKLGTFIQRSQRSKVAKPAGILAMMGAEPGMMMEAAMDPADRQLAIAGHGIQEYSEQFNMISSGTDVVGEWVQLNLAKHQALLVQRIRVWNAPTSLGASSVGLKWGRPAGAIGRGAPGHLSPGQQFTLPRVGDEFRTVGGGDDHVRHMADIGFTWSRGTSGGVPFAADPSTQEIDLRPNFVLIRSYTVLIGGLANPMHPYINLFGKIVNLDFSNVLSVRT